MRGVPAFMRSTEYCQYVTPLIINEGEYSEHLPYYNKVPKDLKENLIYRRETVNLAMKDSDFAAEIKYACSKDILFYLNTFAWTYNPKNRQGNQIIPFISYEAYQDKAIMMIVMAIFVGYDIVMEKSRDMGASWLVLLIFEWFWHFYEMNSFLLISRNEDYVDKKDDDKSLFWKLDFILKYLPRFIKPKVNRTKLKLVNLSNGSIFTGESTTGEASRGNRKTAMLIDEHAAFEVSDGYNVLGSSRDATDCRIFNSTPKGVNNAYYDITRLEDITKIRMHWTLHPTKAAGLYTTGKDYKLIIIDKEYKYPENYRYILDGKVRSPWYDTQEKRCVSKKEISQELDINYFGAGGQYFDIEFLEKSYIPEICKEPEMEGEFVLDDEDACEGHFERQKGGRFKLWITLNEYEGPSSNDEYFFAADISAGTGASNSVLSIGSARLGSKIAEWADSSVDPNKLANLAVAICKWFNNAFMIWEANGPGQIFGKKIVDEIGYDNIYYRMNDTTVSKKVSDIPGWWNVGDAKTILLGAYRNNLGLKRFINYCVAAVKECFQYIYTTKGIEHSSMLNSEDAAGAKKHHGDRTIADALLNKVMIYAEKKKEIEEEMPEQSVGGRLDKALIEERKINNGW